MTTRYRRRRRHTAPKAHSKAEKCATKYCRNRRAEKVTRYLSPKGNLIQYTNFLDVCWKCKAKRLKERHPETYALMALRSRARQRKVPFTLTLAQFRSWCVQTGYLEAVGKDPFSATIDRINHDEGYHIWNIQILSHAENSAQGHTVPGVETVQNERQLAYPEREPDYKPSDEPDYEPSSDPNCPF